MCFIICVVAEYLYNKFQENPIKNMFFLFIPV